MAKFHEERRYVERNYDRGAMEPRRELERNMLEVVLTEEEYLSVKKGVLENFK